MNASMRQRANGRWEVRWTTLDGRRRGRSFPSEAEAQEFRHGIRREQIRLEGGSLPTISVRSFVEEKWWPAAEARVARSTAARWRNELDNNILPVLGSRRLALVRVEDIDDLYRRRAESGVAHETILKLRSVLSNIWTEAQRLGYADSNPIRLSRLPTRPTSRSRDTVLSLREVQQIGEEASRIWSGYEAPILIAGAAGLRWGEMAALAPGDLDLESGLVRVNKALSEVAGGFEVKEPKTPSSNRVAVFHADIASALEAHLRTNALPHRLFPSPSGGWLRRSNFSRRVWKPALRRSGHNEEFTYHSLRKTYATTLAELGATPRAIADLLGHSRVSTTLDIYSSRFDGQVERMAQLMGHRRLRVVNEGR